MSAMPVISVKDLKKTYVVGDIQVHALRGVSVDVEQGEFVCVTGPSGSGKSTFMHILGCLDKPTSGQYILDGQDVSTMSRDELAKVRNHRIGFVFQGFNLLSRTSAIENVELPLLYSRDQIKGSDRHKRARAALEIVGCSSGRTTTRTSCRAASSSAWRSRARSSTTRRSCSPTSRRATSTAARASR